MSESISAGPPDHTFLDRTPAGELRAERLMWQLALAGAAVSVVVGLSMLVWPDASLVVGAVLFGIWLVAQGAIRIVDAVTAGPQDTVVRAFSGVIGMLFIVAGVICLRNVLVSLLTVATVIGVSLLISGIVQVIAAVAARGAQDRLLAAGLGAVAGTGGLVVLVWPAPTLTTVVLVTGVWLVVMGLIQLGLVVRHRPRRIG